MHVDTPATIAVLGAGPIGLEAGLYARYLGYDVQVYERGRVGEHLRQFAHVRLFSPWGANISPLGVAALSAQDPNWQAPDDTSLPTAGEFVDRYLIPLSQTDLLSGCVHEGVEVLAVGRESVRKPDRPGSYARAKRRFRLLLRDADGRESVATADVVIDATGVYGNPAWVGDGGIPAVGERRLRKQAAKQNRSERLLEYGLPDILGSHRKHYAGKTVMVVGAGHSAATNVLALVELARQENAGQVVWVTRRLPGEEGVVRRLPNDPLAERDRLAVAAAQATTDEHVQLLAGWTVDALEEDGERLRVRLIKADPIADDEPDDLEEETELPDEDDVDELDDEAYEGDEDDEDGEGDDEAAPAERETMEIVVDRLIANVGYCPDRDLYRELQVHECFASEAPKKGNAAAESTSTTGPERLLTPEPSFYVLGAKSSGRNAHFLIAQGLIQIRDLFRMVGGRAGLDVYATMSR